MYWKGEDGMPNIKRDKDNVLVFARPQRYRVYVNSKEDESVTAVIMRVPEGARIKSFFHSFRRWLISMDVPVVQYLWAAKLQEVICGHLPKSNT